MELDANIQMLQAQIQAGTGDPVEANNLRLQIADLEKIKAAPTTIEMRAEMIAARLSIAAQIASTSEKSMK
jgi:hypothetical protein